MEDFHVAAVSFFLSRGFSSFFLFCSRGEKRGFSKVGHSKQALTSSAPPRPFPQTTHPLFPRLPPQFETHPSIPGKGTIGTFGVFDGHGGDRAAAFVSRELFRSVLSSEEFASGDAARALTAGFLATDRAYLLAGDEEDLEAARAAAEAEEAARRNKVLVRVKSIFNKGGGGRNGSGEIGNGNGGSGGGHSELGLSPPLASAGALSDINGGGGTTSLSPPLTPTEAPLAGSISSGGGDALQPSPPPAAVSTPSPSRQRAPPRDDGCTAAVALVLGDERLLVAHVGDSRAVLVEPASSSASPAAAKDGDRARRGGGGGGKKSEEHAPSSSSPSPLTATTTPAFTARALSTDHKPNRPDERARIEAAGGAVLWAGTWRVGGVLAVSRAFGDSALKLTSGVVADPDVREERLRKCPPSASSSSSPSSPSSPPPFAPLLILATDGVWDALTADEAASIALAHLGDLEAAARALTTEAWQRGSADNATAVVVRLGGGGPPR